MGALNWKYRGSEQLDDDYDEESEDEAREREEEADERRREEAEEFEQWNRDFN